jgi:hypothetical protein
MSVSSAIIVGLMMLLAGCAQRATPASQPFANSYKFFRIENPPPSTETSVRPPPGALPMRDAAVLEAALRGRLRGEERDTTIFISIGSIENWQDPPADFLARLSDLPYRFKPVSKARFPKHGEMESPNRLRGVEDPVIGKRTWIYWAEIKNWVSDTRVRVDVGVWSGPLGGGGSICVFELRGGTWVLTDTEGHWVS